MFLYVYLMPAMEQHGCPICHVKNLVEKSYLENLIFENVNDVETRIKFIASLGYCPVHAWQLGMMECEEDGDAIGNSILYEDLVRVVLRPLEQYEKEYKAKKHNIGFRILNWYKRWRGQLIDLPHEPYSPMIRSKCRVCQIGENNEKYYLEHMLKDFSQPESRLREKYLRSDGLCLQHFRMALNIQKHATESGAQFLIHQMLETLPKLARDLREFADKHAWNRKNEEMTPDERISWIRAIRFFAGNEGNILLEDPKEFLSDNKFNNDKKNKND